MKLLDTWQWQLTRHMRMRKANVFLLDAQKNYCNARKIYWMHGKFTGCMAVASARIIRVHALHGANSWSVRKKNPRFLANQIAGILRPIV